MAEKHITALIARAIVHLNFHEPDEARTVLLDALTEINFPATQSETRKEHQHGNPAAAA